MKIRIAIIDDHPLLINGLKALLGYAPDIEIIGTYQNGSELLKGLDIQQPDVLLLDIQLEGQMGDELAKILHKKYPGIMILVLTNMKHEYYIRFMLQYGVKGYVLKNSDESVLLEAIRTVSKGNTYFDPAIRKLAHIALKQDNNNIKTALTRREIEILRLLVSDYSSRDIAEKLNLSNRTIENHRMHLLQKFGVKNSATLVKKAIELGMIEG